MRGRPRQPGGHRVHVNIKLSDAEASAIDAARGELERGPWMREAAVSVARQAATAQVQERLGLKIITDERQPPGVVGIVSRDGDGNAVSAFALAAEEARPSRTRNEKADPCPHRIQPGSYCKTCGRMV